MIKVHRLDGKEFVVNADLIETVEKTPDTVISLATGRKHVVAESVDEVIRLVVEFNRQRMRPETLSAGERPSVGRGAVAGQAAQGERLEPERK
ncbi:MAG: flagellar FlbD family protein [Limnochordaceae bacterium]|nr:flagellar FlbD family protein [Limnochordaceae bacterium]